MEYNTINTTSTLLLNVTPDDISRMINSAVNKAFIEAEKRKKPELPETLMSVNDAATELRQCPATLHNWRKQGKMRMIKNGGKYAVKASEVEYIKQYGTRPTK